MCWNVCWVIHSVESLIVCLYLLAYFQLLLKSYISLTTALSDVLIQKRTSWWFWESKIITLLTASTCAADSMAKFRKVTLGQLWVWRSGRAGHSNLVTLIRRSVVWFLPPLSMLWDTDVPKLSTVSNLQLLCVKMCIVKECVIDKWLTTCESLVSELRWKEWLISSRGAHL